MSRPAFSLDDDHARQLIGQLQALEARHPFDPRDHRPFVRDFLRAVHGVTGAVYGPATYRKLLAAYAPQRRPSTTTLAHEKDLLVGELKREQAGSAELIKASAPELAKLVRLAVIGAIGQAPAPRQSTAIGAPTGAKDGTAATIWKERAVEFERLVREAHLLAGRQAAELESGQQTIVALREDLAQTKQVLGAQTVQLERLAGAIEDARLLYLRAVDDARGETRSWRERCACVEAAARAKAKDDQLLLETFRQLAYQRGAAIPPALRKETP
ncbi:hypothetical protein [Massilia sp. DWR3-1-1]|uniref:hypothetical protein n=1 Tax=Massilia sp. DWR3-1-1 TaxID=2804559 RepID=UPI003CE6C239